MPTDLTAAIRDALHAADIDAAELRRPTLRDQRRSRRRTRDALVVAASALVVAAVVSSVTLVAPWQDTDQDSVATDHPAGRETDVSPGATASSPAPASQAGYVGFRWELVRVEDARGDLDVPASFDGTISFAPGGRILGEDSINGFDGRYEKVPGGFRVRDVLMTLKGYAGIKPPRRRIIEAMHSVLGLDALLKAVPRPGSVRISISLEGDVLTLSRESTTLALTRKGPAPNVPPGERR